MRRVAGLVALLVFLALAIVSLGVRRTEAIDQPTGARCPESYVTPSGETVVRGGAVESLLCAYAPVGGGYVLAGSTAVVPGADGGCPSRADYRYLIVLVYRARPPAMVDPQPSRAARACR